MEYFDIYNKYGEKTGEIIERKNAHKNGICHRAVHLWILNQNNEVLIQQRSASKGAGAGLWYVSVAGHIEAGENIESTLIRETAEELGLDVSHLMNDVKYLYTFLECSLHRNGTYIDNEFFDVFALKADFDVNQIIMQPEEVQNVKYVKYDDFKKIIHTQDESFWQHKVGYKLLLPSLDAFAACF